MIETIKKSGPVVIGGVGGSGTRVIAQLLIELGFYMGIDLNHAKDNLLFTLLFKRPKWFMRNSNENSPEIFKGLDIFEKAMTGFSNLRLKELKFIIHAVSTMAVYGNNQLGAGRGVWPLVRFLKLLRSRADHSRYYTGWGWKEPNTHMYIGYLSRRFKGMKFILTMRHGIDMAYSKNQQQFHNWCGYFGIEVPETKSLFPEASLRYWIKANQRAIALGSDLLGDRFLIVNFDEMCYAPRENVMRLLRFLELDTKSIDIPLLCGLIKVPESIGRYKTHDLGIFREQQINEVKNLGFEVENRKSSIDMVQIV